MKRRCSTKALPLRTPTRSSLSPKISSLQDGLSQGLRLFLIRLRAKDSAAADILVTAALQAASQQHPGRLFDVLVLWDYAYQPQDFYFNGIVWDRDAAARLNTAPQLKRSVLAFAVTA